MYCRTDTLYFQKEDQFPCKISGSMFTWFTCFDIGMACVLSGLSFSRSQRKNYMPMSIISRLVPWLLCYA